MVLVKASPWMTGSVIFKVVCVPLGIVVKNNTMWVVSVTMKTMCVALVIVTVLQWALKVVATLANSTLNNLINRF